MSLFLLRDGVPRGLFRAIGTLAVCVAFATSATAQQAAKRVIDEQGTFDRGSQESQRKVTRYAQQTAELLGEYRLTLQQLDRVRIYNDNLQAIVTDQEAEITSIETQLANFEETEQGIVPLMLDMIADLKSFIEADMPFQTQERTDRIARLEDNMTDSNLTVSEKYRQIMEAYKIEAGFGRTIEAYEGTVNLNGADTQVEFLRVGRVVLAYQTRDESITGLWNKQTKNWEIADSGYRRAVTDGLALAKKQAAPTLLVLPVPGAEAAR